MKDEAKHMCETVTGCSIILFLLIRKTFTTAWNVLKQIAEPHKFEGIHLLNILCCCKKNFDDCNSCKDNAKNICRT